MPSTTISELIQMYSTGIISRESLERNIQAWSPGRDGGRDHDRHGVDDHEFIVLYPDASGVWRANNA